MYKILCPFCNSSRVMANDNKVYCFSCRKQFNLKGSYKHDLGVTFWDFTGIRH